MPAPDGFSWVDKPLLAGMARPGDREEFSWLREQGIQLLISLTEYPPRRDWINEAGLLHMHIPVEDLHAPAQKQIDLCISAIDKAHSQGMGVGLHCAAGLGRTGTMLACYFVTRGLGAKEAIDKVRKLRPGSIETDEQEESIIDFALRRRKES
ncbi:MAG: dual specificity protein phosphatase family protein [Gemmataceae bacterium]|nr:dual specificity protein phosphatase family protein [Gemmataceae bacterium]MCI0738508.1 dual specificity protein phosphatase family protein [Gemmataceae bacterium]